MKNFIVMILLMVVGVSCKVKDEASFHSVVDRDSVSLVSKDDGKRLPQSIKSETTKDIKIDTIYPGYPQIDTLQYLVDKEFLDIDSTELNAIVRYSFNPYHEFFNDQYYDVLGGALIRDSILFHQLVTESLKFTDFKRHKILCSIDEALGWHCFVNYVVEDVNYVVQDMDYTKFYKQTDSDEQTIIALQAFRDSLATDKEATICAMYGLKNDH